MILFDQIAAQLPEWRERVNRLKKDHGSFKVGDVTVDQIYSGIRDVQIQPYYPRPRDLIFRWQAGCIIY
jgi:citrate synthase